LNNITTINIRCILKGDLKDLDLIRIITYPVVNQEVAKERLQYLYKIGVRKIYLVGPISIGRYNVLGKGNNSIVLLARFKRRKVALKVLRLDAQRETLLNEAEILRKANKLGIGPKLYYSTDWLIIEEYIKGLPINKFLILNLMKKRLNIIRNMIINLLIQCYKLDQEGIDHGELSRCSKHILVTKYGNPVILDFETASLYRKTKNVTSITQCIIKRMPVGRIIISGMIKVGYSYNDLIKALREYKKKKSLEKFKHITEIIANSLQAI